MEGLEFRGLKLNLARVLDEMVKTLFRIVIFGPEVWGVVRTAVTENETAIVCVSMCLNAQVGLPLYINPLFYYWPITEKNRHPLFAAKLAKRR